MLIGSSNSVDLVGPGGGLVGPGENIISGAFSIARSTTISFAGTRAFNRAFSINHHLSFVTTKSVLFPRAFSMTRSTLINFAGGRLRFGTFTISHPLTISFDRVKIFGRSFTISKSFTFKFDARNGIATRLRLIFKSPRNILNKLGILFRPSQ